MTENFAQTLTDEELDNSYLSFETNFNKVIESLNFYIKKMLESEDLMKNQVAYDEIERIEIYKKFLEARCIDFFKYNKKYLSYFMVGRKYEDFIVHLINQIKEYGNKSDIQSMYQIYVSLLNLSQAFDTITDIVNKEKQANLLISELRGQVEKATETVKSVVSAKEALESKPTEDIYSNAAKKYIKTARFYDFLLLVTLGIFYYITSNFFENFQMISIFKAIKKSSSEAQTLAIFFFITKLTIVSIVITLATIFIRRSSHFRKLHDQANQTSLELNALPNYLRQVDSEHHSEIYKEMIPKFFGKELDQSQNDKVGDLVKDQLAAGTELIKASAEMVKNMKSLSGSADKTKITKTNNTSTEDKTKSAGEG